MTDTRHRTDGRLPRRFGAIARLVDCLFGMTSGRAVIAAREIAVNDRIRWYSFSAYGPLDWPPALLLLFLAAFSGADAGDRVGDNNLERVEDGSIASEAAKAGTSIGSAADSVDQCDEQAARLDVSALERCLLVQPDDVELMLDLGAAYESGGRWADAERVYLRATRVDPRDGEAHRRLGRGYRAHGDLAAARREGEAARATQPGNPDVLHLVEADPDSAEP